MTIFALAFVVNPFEAGFEKLRQVFKQKVDIQFQARRCLKLKKSVCKSGLHRGHLLAHNTFYLLIVQNCLSTEAIN